MRREIKWRWILKWLEMAAWDAYLLGAAIIIFALWALYAPKAWEEWTNLFLGLWLMISPIALGFSLQRGPTWNMEVVGMAVMLFAGFTLPGRQPPARARN